MAQLSGEELDGGTEDLMADLTREEKEALRKIFAVRPEEPCIDCGGYHLRACGRIKRQVWIGEGSGAGNRIEVEYWETWDDSDVIYPEDAWDPEGMND